eukprot:6093259-Pleurochrysis_carterae.AAC.1
MRGARGSAGKCFGSVPCRRCEMSLRARLRASVCVNREGETGAGEVFAKACALVSVGTAVGVLAIG